MDEEYYFDDWDTGSDYYAPSDYEPVWNEDLTTGFGSLDNYEAPYFDGSGFQLSDFQLPENYSDQFLTDFPWAADAASLGQGTWGDFAPGAVSTEGLPMEAYLVDRDPGLSYVNQAIPGAVSSSGPEEQALQNVEVQNRMVDDGAQVLGGGFVNVNGQTVSIQDYVNSLNRPEAMSYSPEDLHSGTRGAFPVGTFPDGRDSPSSSYLDRNGDVVGLLGTEGTDYQNPYEYRTADNGQTFIQDIRNGGVEGWVDDDLRNRFYQDVRIGNNVDAGRSALYGVQRPGSPGSEDRGATAGYRSPSSSSGGSSPARSSSSERARRLSDGTASNQDRAQAAAGGLSMAALMALELMKQGRTGPGSSQGTIGTNQWNIARMNNRGVAPTRAKQGGLIQMADGGSVKERLMKMFGPLFAPATTEPRRPRQDFRDPDVRGLIYEDRGMLPDAGRVLTGRRNQLDELERQAVEGRARGGSINGGQSDVVHIAAAPGEYVMDADIVSALGDGSTDAGAAKLDQMREAIRTHKRGASRGNIPPKAKSPLAYMKGRVK